MREEEWDAYLQRLIDGSRTAIEQFAAQHPMDEVCFFAYDSEPCYGYVLTCFNTAKANINYMRLTQEERVKYRQELLADPRRRKRAYYSVWSNSVRPYCNNTGEFAYERFATIDFPEWQEFAESDQYPQHEDRQDDYLYNRVALIFAEALDTLAKDGSFEKLRLASPTLLGFAFHDEEQYVLRILRLPSS